MQASSNAALSPSCVAAMAEVVADAIVRAAGGSSPSVSRGAGAHAGNATADRPRDARTPLSRFATRVYTATSSAIFLAMSFSESSSVLRPLREPRSGLIARISS